MEVPRSRWSRLVIGALLAAPLLALGYAAWRNTSAVPQARKSIPSLCPKQSTCHHVYDIAGVLPPENVRRFEQYMEWILRESDVDLRFAFVSGTGGKTIEELAVDMVHAMRIGGNTREERGVLLLYETNQQQLKVEVGYGLEAYFPDAFVGYLIQDHARMFFESRDLSLGLRLLLRLLQHRIREAVLGDEFDPSLLDAVRASGYLSGGAGVTATMPSGRGGAVPPTPRMSDVERSAYRAQGSPARTFSVYLEWLSAPKFDPDVDLFTADSRRYLSRLLITPLYKHFILFGEYGKRYRIVERNDLAILYFTTTPFTSPHFFVKQGGVWRMDIAAEVHNTVEHVGGIYTWGYRGEGDRYTLTFSDLLTNLHGYRRFKDGDNRALVIRGSKGL